MKTKPPILVTGAHRTGTTWVGKMLAAGKDTAYLSEPLNVLHRPGVLRVPVHHWYTYICPENEASYLPALRETLAFRYHPWLELRSLRARKDLLRMGRDAGIFLAGRLLRRRPVIKDPFALFSAPWFAERLGCQVVVTVRHPAAFASSLKRLGWPFDFNHLLSQPLLMRDWLEPYREAMQAQLERPADDIVAQAGLLWRMIYEVIATFQAKAPGVQVVRHEDLSSDPLAGYRSLYHDLGLAFTDPVQAIIQSASSSENPAEGSKKNIYAVRLDSRVSLQNWKRRLSEAEIERILELTHGTLDRYYPDAEARPV